MLSDFVLFALLSIASISDPINWVKNTFTVKTQNNNESHRENIEPYGINAMLLLALCITVIRVSMIT